MRKLVAGTAAVLVAAACSASPTTPTGAAPRHSGFLGGSGNFADSTHVDVTGNRTAATMDVAADSTRTERGGFLGGSGN